MRILVLGSGAREHAILTALAGEDDEHELLVAPGSDALAEIATRVPLADISDGDAVASLAQDRNVDLVVVGPEAPLIAGVSDPPRERGIAVFGPSAAAARLEGSKSFAKRIMAAAGVPTARSTLAHTRDEAAAALAAYGAPHVIKADGLAAGKGVLVSADRAAADSHAAHWLEHGPVLIEEHLAGAEVSLFFLSDGSTVLPLAPAQDYKRLGNADQGPNTGGMGAYSPLPWLADAFGSEKAFVQRVLDEVALPTIRQLDSEGTPFIGLLYCGLIVSGDRIRVIEFNARFGDPETQVVLPRLIEPLSDLLYAAATGTLAGRGWPRFREEVAIGVVLASEGYPEHPVSGRSLTGLAEARAVSGVHLAHAATERDTETSTGADAGTTAGAGTGAGAGTAWRATGGRVLTVVAVAPSFAAARERAYRAIAALELDGGQYRTDIGARVVEPVVARVVE